MIKNLKKYIIGILFLGLVIALISLVFSIPEFGVSGTTNQTTEDLSSPFFVFNTSALVSVNSSDPDDAIITYSIRGINSSLNPTQTNVSFYSWITINSSNGNLTINATLDNQTGRFNISILVENSANQGESRLFYFIVNATNDMPNITTIQNEYNLTEDQNFLNYLNGTDEESHFPLTFNVSFLTNCTLAQWSNRTTCDLLNAVNVTNTSARINLTPGNNDVGTYYANISVRDYGANYTCTGYCESNYSINRTRYYSTIVIFNVFSTLTINASNCENAFFQENQTNLCQINISTKTTNATINVSTNATLRNYNGNVSNVSWFYPVNKTFADNFSRTIFINVTPGKTEVGNWTINFSVVDLTNDENTSVSINIYVNRTFNDIPDIFSVSETTTSIILNTTINLTVHDDDLLIPDKNVSFGGYNETTNFSLQILNRSNITQTLSLTGFDVEILNMPVAGTNRTEARIQFTPNSSEYGNYTINITVNDNDSSRDFMNFNLTILNNAAPQWNTSSLLIFYEGNLTNINFSLNVSDSDGDTLTFSFANNTAFPSFSLNSTTGVVNFSSVDGDVGQHLVNITVSDGYLTNTTEFNFTIYNVNDNVLIEKPIESGDVTNATVDSNSNINTSEDNYTIITLWIHDEDFKIPSGQKKFYNETLVINLTIEGRNTNLFSFTRDIAFPTAGSNRSRYDATFTPNKSDVGSYNITINVSDNSSSYDFLRFNLTVLETLHGPVLMNLTNQTSAENRSLYYRINASDTEDGSSTNSGNMNFTFNYSFLNGSDFINNNRSIFNITTGELNITFNSTQGGSYRINISVNDSDNNLDSGTFWIYVYDVPNVTFPLSDFQFSLVENVSSNITFTANHSVLDNLTYTIYITINENKVLRLNTSSYGNGSNLSWGFTPNFTDEVNSGNLTLIVYPTSSDLINSTSLNITRSWNLTINHTNYPLSFSGTIGGADALVNGTSPITVNLDDYFTDYDASDSRYNQTIGFIFNELSSNGSITITFTNWTNGTKPRVRFSADSSASVSGYITAQEFNHSNSSHLLNSVVSNNFTVNLTVTETTTTTTSSGGGGGGASPSPVAFKLIVPGSISAYKNERIDIPLVISNTGTRTFSDISLKSYGVKEGEAYEHVSVGLDKTFISTLTSNTKQNILMTVFFNNDSLIGNYEIYVNATSKSPSYSDWAKISISLQELNVTALKKFLIYTEELIVGNPQCLELQELVNEAKKHFDDREYGEARLKAEKAINACKESIEQVSLPRENKRVLGLPFYLIVSMLMSMLLGIGYYFLRRIMLRVNLKEQFEIERRNNI